MANTAQLTGLWATTGTGSARLTGLWAATMTTNRTRLTGLWATTGASLAVTLGGAFTADAYDTVQLTCTATDAGMTPPSSWAWTQTAGPTVVTTATGGVLSFIAPASVNGTAVTIQVVADGAATATVTVTCRAWPGPWRGNGAGVLVPGVIGGPRPAATT